MVLRCASQQIWCAHVGCGSIASFWPSPCDVRSSPGSDRDGYLLDPESLVAAPIARRLYAVGEGVGLPPSPGLPIAIVADVHYVPEASMRLIACLAMCLMLILANAAQTGAQAPSDPQAYCVNVSADFYPYTGEPCKGGYQLGSGNCRRTDGVMIAAPREECLAQAGTVEVHFFYDRGSPPPFAPRR